MTGIDLLSRNINVTAGDVSFTVRPRRTGADAIFSGLVFRKLLQGLQARGGEWAEITDRAICDVYANAVGQTVSAVGHVLPGVGASAAEHADGFERWITQDNDVLLQWIAAVQRANEPANDPALIPPAKLTDEKKASIPSDAPKSKSA